MRCKSKFALWFLKHEAKLSSDPPHRRLMSERGSAETLEQNLKNA